MRRRPQPNPRRGFARAALVVVVLTLVLLLAAFVVSSLTAPAVKAPVVPASPARPTTPGATASPTTAKPAATPVPTKKKAALERTQNSNHPLVAFAAEEMSGRYLAARLRASNLGTAAASPDRSWIAAVRNRGGVYARDPVTLMNRRDKFIRTVGWGDPFVRPVWSPDGLSFLYVRVASSASAARPLWDLVQVDVHGFRQSVLARERALNLTPLGWDGKRVLFLVANSADTAIYAAHAGKVAFVSILMPQPLTTASMAMRPSAVAFGTPTTCGPCALDLFDLTQAIVWSAPFLIPDASTVAWTRDGGWLVSTSGGRVVALNAASHAVRWYLAPRSLPSRWTHQMTALVSAGQVSLVDGLTGVSYRAVRSNTAGRTTDS